MSCRFSQKQSMNFTKNALVTVSNDETTVSNGYGNGYYNGNGYCCSRVIPSFSSSLRRQV